MTQVEIDAEVAIFKPQHQLYLNPTNEGESLYRVFPIDTLLELLIENKLTLVKTKFWEDPYENYIFKCNWNYFFITHFSPAKSIFIIRVF